ncbi:hypothetical protein BD410DRAFT_498624 [Rickenella mellea]|uniref:Uncharacterized protein n=1 Tax=Rickenella mellea TaxID=50990 RepID=A0A4Y7PU13_9AGAM|nr:hypothetical protein BD410DRAFT_498624 [Rickenella mellea]
MLHPWSADCCRRCAERGIMCVPKPKVQKERRTRRKPYDKSPENSKCEDPKAGSSSTSTATVSCVWSSTIALLMSRKAVPERVQPQPLPRDDMAMAQSPTLSAGGSSGRGMVGAETSNFRGGIGSHHPSPPHAATLQPQFYQHVNGQFTARCVILKTDVVVMRDTDSCEPISSSSNTASASSLRSLDYTMSYEFPLESSPSSDAPAHRMGAQPEFVPNSATTLGDSFVWSSLGYPREL